MSHEIHPTAVVDPRAELADGVRVGPHAFVGPEVQVGEGTVIGPGVVVHGPTTIGRENRFVASCSVGSDPQDLKYDGEPTRLEIGDRNQVREYVTINRGTVQDRGVTTVGDDNLFMAYAHVGHDCMIGSRVVFANAATLAGHVEVQDDATISAFSSVHQFCRVGRHAYVGGYSVLTMDALPFVKTVGQKPLCYGINHIGLKRKGFAAETITALRQALRVLLESGLNTSQALERLEEEATGDAEVAFLVEFVRSAKRGVVKGLPGQRRKGRGGGGA